MCGIFGYFDGNNRVISFDVLKKMGDVIKYRGPDGYGCYHNQESAVALGNQRLAIFDVEHGQQPFLSDDGNIVVVQNGEIFNHVELSKELDNDGYPCKTSCDTESILRLYERNGIGGISKLNGMFAIAIYDRNIETLYLIRDRVGEKPLYFSCEEGGRVIFASEIKSILQATSKKSPNPKAINQFLAFNYVPPPLTMFKGVQHVMPGSYLKITNNGVKDVIWWDLSKVKSKRQTEAKWIRDFNYILDDSVRIRLRSDVSFGAFLSGGVDSSSVVGLMSKYLDTPVNTFCIGFNDSKYDESPFAQDAANRFHTQHTMKKVDSNMMDLWPMATYHCDQPHGDVSFLPTYKVAQLASEKVKMVLTGDGADELFAGYDKYKNFFTDDIDKLSDSEFQRKYLDNISLFDKNSRNQLFSDHFKQKLGDLDVSSVTRILFEKSKRMDRINQALYIDTMLLLSGNNLVKPDRMSMAVSIENRAPFLDYRMLSLAFSMPGKLKLKDGVTKYLYKKAVAPLIGEDLAYRKKQMFTVPVGEWFKTDLAEMCEDLLLSRQTQKRKLFNYTHVASLLNNHQKGVKNNTREIRALVALEIWFRQFDNFVN
ncbi:asparagine synthase (glutamine-hydrolyzing) [Bathymodiolus thermophilus thioautotrophic gill symbiont]|uniref:asparagine synthase (glutamine-hydrolyzing) n=1 Tax=Bathymodiolus thermophilus thioautotrophic gill symbiont TaxID=2360 RepID=A0A1J5TXZ1_9GAMM|nr:asparagine synthase (glutamine-hydrolyzing) [Bathymodiolus thermophilus thioautotrophic gill symbiont]OIR25618.1 asparagine synthase (glutamine-hydrolyzing) [Bathymodiolus thermophilus thioautotrophic gill symbiont]